MLIYVILKTRQLEKNLQQTVKVLYYQVHIVGVLLIILWVILMHSVDLVWELITLMLLMVARLTGLTTFRTLQENSE